MVETWIGRFIRKEGPESFTDIEGWRGYYFDLILFLACVLLPIALAATLSTYIREERWGTLFFETGIFAFLAVLFFIRNPLFRWGMFFLFLYATVITFFISLGPFYARPAWLVLCSVTAALLFGIPAALTSVGLNAVILLVLYYFVGPSLASWSNVYIEPDIKWIIFTINTSFVSLVASLPVSLLLRKLSLSFRSEKALRENLLNESELARDANSALTKEIAERKRIEDELRNSERRYRLLAENVRDVIWVFDMNLDHTFVTPSVKQLRGYTVEEALRQTMDQILTPSSFAVAREILDKELKAELGGQRHGPEWSMTTELEMVRKDGSTVWTEVTINLLYDEMGDPAGIIGVTRDISERRKAQAELKESRQMLRMVLDTIPVRVFWKDRESNYLGCNSLFCQDAGIRTTDEVVGMDDHAMPWAEYADLYRSHDREVMDSGMALLNYVQPEARSDGSTAWLRTSKLPLRDADGRISGILGVYEDITEQKKAEEMLTRQVTLFQNLFESSPEAIAILDREDRVLEVNRSFESLFGYTRTEAVGRGINALLAPEPYLQDAQDTTQAVIGNGQVVQKEGIRCTKYGHPVHVSLIGYPIVLNGQQTGAFAIYRDITEQKKAQEELLASEQRFRLAFQTSPDAININQLDNGMYVDINEGFTALTGFTREDVIGKTSVEINIWHDPDDRKKLIRGLLERGFYQNLEAQFRKKDGSIGIGLMSARIITLKGIPHILSITREITDLKRTAEEKSRLENQLVQAQKMESIGRLAGGVAHDFNNMLAAILGHVELAKEKCRPSDPIYGDLEVIEKAANRSAALTRQLLAFARRQTVEPKILDLNDVVAGMLKMLQRLIGEDIDFAWMPGAGLWQVRIDPSQVDQILANLCVNARDAIDGVGRITIETENVSLDESCSTAHPGSPGGQFVMIAVSDSGRGMEREILDQIFEPFFTTKGTGEGTGLGLATVYGIVKQNEGFIEVWSEPGKGSTFKVYLPRFLGTDTDPGTEKTTGTMPRGCETVLLVEDEEVVLNLGKAMLEKLGYRVLTAATPREALRLAKMHAGEIQLLITDVIMPEMNGRDLVRSINSVQPGIRSLYISGYTADVIVHRGILDEGVHFLQKPFSLKDLAEKVRSALE